MLIGAGDIGNDLSLVFQCVCIHTHFHFALICANLTAQSTGNHKGIGGGIQISEM